MRKIILIMTILLAINFAGSYNVFGQYSSDHDRVEMADKFRQDGKIYVVVAIIGVVLAGMFIYTIRIDQKIRRLEDEFNKITLK
jgi:hypothetical protein